jgi:flagellar hook-associated protein 2
MGSVSNSSSLFTGSSQFSTDLQNVITRAVAFATLPITQMNSQVTNLQNQSKALDDSSTGIDAKFAAVQTAIQNITDAMKGSSFQTIVSSTSAVTVSLDDDAQEGIHSIDVQDPGAYAASVSTAAWATKANPAGSSHTYQLVIGTDSPINITAADNSAASVVAAINQQAGDKVHATLVNVGPNDTRISIQANSLGTGNPNLQDNGASLQQVQTEGKLAKYVVDGVTNSDGSPMTSTSRSVTLAPGVTVNLNASSGGVPVDITISRSTSSLSTALEGFANAYNDAVDALKAQRGQSGGALAGKSIVNDLRRLLTNISTYTGDLTASSSTNGVSTLADLGLELNDTLDGHLSFNQFKFLSKDISNSTAINAFLGSTTGGGFLKTATDALKTAEDPTSGIIKATANDIQTQISNLQAKISTKQDQVDQLQQRLLAQMAAADAALASMEQQYSFLSSVFQAQQVAEKQNS